MLEARMDIASHPITETSPSKALLVTNRLFMIYLYFESQRCDVYYSAVLPS